MPNRALHVRGRARPASERLPVFEERLRARMVELGMTGRELAATIGVDETAVSCWFSGRARPSLSRLLELCQVLSVDPNWLLGWSKQAAATQAICERALLRSLNGMTAALEEIRGGMYPRSPYELPITRRDHDD